MTPAKSTINVQQSIAMRHFQRMNFRYISKLEESMIEIEKGLSNNWKIPQGNCSVNVGKDVFPISFLMVGGFNMCERNAMGSTRALIKTRQANKTFETTTQIPSGNSRNYGASQHHHV